MSTCIAHVYEFFTLQISNIMHPVPSNPPVRRFWKIPNVILKSFGECLSSFVTPPIRNSHPARSLCLSSKPSSRLSSSDRPSHKPRQPIPVTIDYMYVFLKEAWGGWVSERTDSIWCCCWDYRSFINCCIWVDKRRLVCTCHSVCACVCVWYIYKKHGYCWIGNSDRLQYVRFCLLKCTLMWFLSSDVCTAQWVSLWLKNSTL